RTHRQALRARDDVHRRRAGHRRDLRARLAKSKNRDGPRLSAVKAWMDEWVTIVDFLPVADADVEWRRWLRTHDGSNLEAEDIGVDTGRGLQRDVRRYRVRGTAMPRIRLLPQSLEDG